MRDVVRTVLITIGRPIYWLVSTLFYPQAKIKMVYESKKSKGHLWGVKALFKQIYYATHFAPLPLKILLYNVSFLSFVSAILGVLFYFYVLKDLPSPDALTTKPVAQTTHIRDRNGVELYKIYRNQNRTLIKLSDIPLSLRQATLSIEDKDFYRHSGFSIPSIIRAAWRTLTNQQLEGGSTITQQLVKTSLLTPERTLQRKLRELLLAIAVEWKYSKDQILEMYLNRVSYGGTAYGVEEAAQTYFGKASMKLSLAEAALLAGLPASPTTYSPFGLHPELAKQRQKEVLRRMVDDRYIDWQEADQVSSQELKFLLPTTNIKAPHFVMYIREILAHKYGTDVVEQGGLDVITSLDLKLQEEVQRIVSEETARIAYLRIGNGAAIVTNPQTGEILAMVGSRDYFDRAKDGNVNVVLAHRQPGSSIKPINYALALMRGFTPSSIIDDTPITYFYPGQASYSPVNYDGRFHGKVVLRTALGSSYNIPAVKILAANGVANMIDLGQKMGITTWNDSSRFGLSLTLGGGEVTMLDMAKAYGVFANDGARMDLHPILAVRDNQNRPIEQLACANMPPPNSKDSVIEIVSCDATRVFDPKVAYLISDILADNSARSPAFGPRSDLFIPGSQVAVKTGTTNNLKDNWTIGYYPKRLAAVWVGNNDNSPMSYVASGVTGASPIWRQIMNTLLQKDPSPGFTPPSGLIKTNICIITGELACDGCPTKSEFFLPGTEPKRACSPEWIKQYLEEKAKKEQEERDKLLNGVTTAQ